MHFDLRKALPRMIEGEEIGRYNAKNMWPNKCCQSCYGLKFVNRGTVTKSYKRRTWTFSVILAWQARTPQAGEQIIELPAIYVTTTLMSRHPCGLNTKNCLISCLYICAIILIICKYTAGHGWGKYFYLDVNGGVYLMIFYMFCGMLNAFLCL